MTPVDVDIDDIFNEDSDGSDDFSDCISLLLFS